LLLRALQAEYIDPLLHVGAQLQQRRSAANASATSAGFWLGETVPPCRLGRRKLDYEMVHSEVYLNKYVVSIAPFSTPACRDCSQNITYT